MKRALSLVTAITLLLCILFVGTSIASAEGNGVWLDFSTASDEELEEAIVKIKAEQRARLKTTIALDTEELTIAKGKNAKITAEVKDVPEDQKASKITWETSDKTVATCQNGTVRGIGNGKAIIKASCTLSDGTEIYNECPVTVYTAITGLSTKEKKIDIGVGESTEASITIQPKDASNTALTYTTSDSSVATVDANGVITAMGIGSATITAMSTDGSEKSVSFTIKATKKDDKGKTKTDRAGNAVTLLSVKETKGSSYAKPDSGNTFVLLELEIENNSSGELNISSILSFDAYCDGYTCDYSFIATMNTSRQMDGTIASGKKMKGQVAFEVPEGWKEIELHVKPDYWFGTDVEFVIYNQ